MSIIRKCFMLIPILNKHSDNEKYYVKDAEKKKIISAKRHKISTPSRKIKP